MANITVDAQPPSPGIPTFSVVQPTCTVATGTITVTSPTAGLTFSLDGGAYAAYPAAGYTVAAGPHTLTAQNASTCISPVANITVDAQPPTPGIPTFSVVQPTCTVATGTITVTSPTAGLTFSLDGGAYAAYPAAGYTVAAGPHTLTAQNASTCISPVANITVNAQPPIPGIPTFSVVQPTCTVATGTITATSSTAGLTFSLDGGAYAAYPAAGYTVAAGPHTLSAQNGTGCISGNANITVDAQPPTPGIPTFSVVQPTCTVATGTITVTSSTAGLTFSLDGGAYTAYPAAGYTIAAGPHTLSAQNASTCISPVANITVDAQPLTPGIPVFSVVQPTCTVATGTITITSATAGLTFSLDGGAYAAYPAAGYTVSAGAHTLTAQNATSCISPVANINVNTQPTTPALPVFSITQPNCTVATGTITVTVQTAGETYSFDNGLSFQAGNSLSGLAAGPYNIIIRSTGGCNSVANLATIDAQPASPASPSQTTDCSLGFGNAVVTVTSPTGPGIEYRLDAGTYQTALTFAGVGNGSHTITVMNAAGCTTTGSSFSVSCGCVNGPSLTLSSTTGSTCGTTPVTVTNNTFTNATSVTITHNGAGLINPNTSGSSPFNFTYTPAAGDAGNTVLITFTTNNPLGFPCAAATGTYTLTVNSIPSAPIVTLVQPTCTIATGTITITSPAEAGMTYSIDGSTYTNTTGIFSLVPSNTYTVTARSATGCTSTGTIVTINNQLAAPTLPTFNVTDPTCTDATGIITVTSATAGLTFSLDGSAYAPYPGAGYSVAAGAHTLTAQNISGCISPEANITVNTPPLTPSLPTFAVTDPTCIVATGTITITSATTGLTFSLDGGPYIAYPAAGYTVAPGAHTLSAQNGFGCISALANITVNPQPAPLAISTQPLPQTDCYDSQVEFSVGITGGSGAITYQWQERPPSGSFTDIAGAINPVLTINNIGASGQNVDGTEYHVIITDACGTITSNNAILRVNSITDITPGVNTTICSGGSAIYSVTTQGTAVGYQWLKQNGATWDPISDGVNYSGTSSDQLVISFASPAQSGSYRVSVTFSTLNQPVGFPTCVQTSSTFIRNLVVHDPLSPPVITASQSICYNTAPATLTATPATGGSGPTYDYQWQSRTDLGSWANISGETGLSYSPPALTSNMHYRLEATDGGIPWCGVVNSTEVIITVNTIPVAPTASVTAQPTCTVNTGTITITAPTEAGMTYSIDGTNYTNTTGIFTLVAANTYTVTARSAAGCTSPGTSVTVDAQPSAPTIPIETTDCALGFGNATVTVISPTGTGIEYSLDGGTYQTSVLFAGIANGNHTITARNASGCTTTGSSFQVSCGCVNGPILTLSTISSNTCGITPVTISGNTFANANSVTITHNGSGTVNPSSSGTSPFAFTYTPAAGDAGNTVIITVTTNNPLGAPCTAAIETTSISVSANITSIFAPIGPLCVGSVAPALPLNPANAPSVTGSWSPATINTASPGTTTYTFTPDAGQCATTATLDITVSATIIPTFTQIGTVCLNSSAPVLPGTSVNGITGTWSPAVINTSAAGTFTFTFTPGAGQCSSSTTMDIVVASSVTPTFNAVGPFCSGTAIAALPTTSNNGVTGIWAPAIDNSVTTTYTFTPTTGQCATTATLTIIINPNVTPTFDAVAAICSGAVLSPLPTTSNNGITGTWSPALNNTATTVYTFTPSAGQCAGTATLTITVNAVITPTFAGVPAICAGAALSPLPLASLEGITGTWSPALNNSATTTYTFNPTAGQCANTTTLTITVNPIVTPTFNTVPAICSGVSLSPLPLTSLEGITGTWSPALNNSATTTYTFTPTAGQCANTATLTITVNPSTNPTFAPVPAICSGSALAALPLASIEGITGTWTPALSNTVTTTYTFTPTAGQCATTATLTIIVNPNVTPTFDAVASICSGAALSPLPTTSNNGITGTWSPAVNNTATTVYTFTPSAGQCAGTATLTITVNAVITPTFAGVPAICAGAALSPLPLASLEGITGTWSPALNNSATTTYTFNPTAGQCANTTTLTITVNPIVTPTFNTVPAICSGASLSPLPLTSLEGITGTWSPALNNSTTTTYTFTPTAGQCANTATLIITVNPSTNPTFAPVPAICSGAALAALPLTSIEGITGTWTPALSNTVTTTYTFTPTAGQCATTATLTIIVNPNVTPTFDAVAAICSGAALSPLPTTSNNGITGTWSPALNNTATTVYTFTPTAGQCAVTATIIIGVTPSTITPTFTQIGPLCRNSAAPSLPGTSNNSITGTWSPASINTNNVGTDTYTFTPDGGQCANPITMDIVIAASFTPAFSQIGPLCLNSVAPSLPAVSNNGITGTWSPSTISTNTLGTTTYTFTPAGGQCSSPTTMDIAVSANITPTFTQIGPLCENTTAPLLPASSINIPAITGTWSPAAINTSATGSVTYTFTPAAGQCATTTTMTIVVDPQVAPAFTQIAPLCQNSLAPALANTSGNGVTGTWSPAVINTSAAGTATYTFTPSAGQCASTATMDIVITANVTPTFTQIGPLCLNSAAPSLAATSNNGVTGTWSPATVNTSAAGISTYSFTPTAGQCAVTATMNILVTSSITPTFDQIGPLCLNSVPPSLPANSTNAPAITGTWSPATISTNTIGTTTYTFTPAAGQCAAPTTMSIVVTSNITPTFTQIGPLCQNSTAPSLPATSNNGINGTWSPAAINTSATGSVTYTFTPAAGQCATTTTMTIVVDPQVAPAFTQIAPLCQNSLAPALPNTSNNGVIGTWSPAVINSSAAGTATYTFTPSAGQCASTATMDIVITANVTPTFTQIGPLCLNSAAPSLTATSNNGVTGTWSPATVNTAAAGIATYTFTPTAGQCAVTATMNILVTSSITPTFDQIGPLCLNSVPPSLPANSTNAPAITGTWSPATISTNALGTTTYTFTPAAGQCAAPTTMSIVVTSNITPTFTQIGPLCQNSTAPSLPAASNNGINGTWSPAAINTSATGSVIYTFTPAAGQCATTTTMTIVVNPQVAPAFTQIAPLCQNSLAPALPNTSNNGVIGTWSPAVINTSAAGTATYTFTPSAGQCASTATMDIVITANVTPTFTQIGPLCLNSAAPSLAATSNNGVTGTWSPATINTSTAGTATYTFTPTAGQCAVTATMNILVTSSITPTFDQIGPLCLNSVPPSLPANSTNAPAITGTWSPATISTNALGTTTYTFTPAAGQCAAPTTMSIVVTSNITPTFTQIGPLCQNSTAPSLPATSNNGINGTWSPAAINTAATGSVIYTFTPAAGQCATTTTMTIVVDPQVAPCFHSDSTIMSELPCSCSSEHIGQRGHRYMEPGCN